MNKLLKIKVLFMLTFGLMMILFFQKEHFISHTGTMHTFNNIALISATMAMGVIISASIYNLAFYVYIRNRQYLYYGLAQLSTLFFLINLDSIYISPFDEIFGLHSPRLFYLTRASVLLFSLLFIKEFLKIYQVEHLNKLIRVIVYLTLADILFTIIFSYAILTNFIPIFMPIWLVLSEASRAIKEKDMPFYFLLTGWYISIFIAVIEHLGLIALIGIPFPFLHITFAIESIFLSLAISYKFKLLDEKQKMQQSLLLQQSRLASMGEMISIIAHQWKQPLNFLSMVNMNLRRMHKEDKNSSMLIVEANKQIEYMSNTIDSFRDFYNPSKQKEHFSTEEALNHVLTIVSSALSSAKITIKTTITQDFKLYGNRNEFEQVLLNLINNAKDALIERKIENPKIDITIDKQQLTIKDNAKGIKKEYLNKIFDPYFSTKKNSDGIGLYISKMIIEQELNGTLNVKINQEGTAFIINFN
jgi:signal transduction histidine kinase